MMAYRDRRWMRILRILTAVLLGMTSARATWAADATPADTARGDAMVARYFAAETARLAKRSLADVQSGEDWQKAQPILREQLLEMLGLDPLPERTPLEAAITGRVDHDDFVVEKLHFQSRPRLYVTANLYVPKNLQQPAPAVLYVCGHGRVVKNGISYGNKTNYQHHAAWFARHGYVCLIIDTLQLGEIEGIHHGTHREGMWWWNCRGYTPAGVEAWNCIRALDYLESREEVDRARIAVTGRSGGGAYSWWITGIDDRIQAAVPVAGITDLENHVVDGVVEGHCDCMFMVNTYRWDYDALAALAAPRPLLICNTDNDHIFPLDGVVRVHEQVRRIYGLAGAADHLGLVITPGPHSDGQLLQNAAFGWINHYLREDDAPITVVAKKLFDPTELKVFETLPSDELNTRIYESFVPAAEPPAAPESSDEWAAHRDGWLGVLGEKSFRGWPDSPEDLNLTTVSTAEHDGLVLTRYEFTSQEPFQLPLWVIRRSDLSQPDLVVLKGLDDAEWTENAAILSAGFPGLDDGDSTAEVDGEPFARLARMLKNQPWAMAYFAPRGAGPTAWSRAEKNRTQTRRRFMLLGQTLDGMRVWDARRAIQAVRAVESLGNSPLWLEGEGTMGGVMLYASLNEPAVARLDLWNLPKSHRDGPILLNVMRYLDMPQAVAMAAERAPVRIYGEDREAWSYPISVAKQLGWGDERIQLRAVPESDTEAAGR